MRFIERKLVRIISFVILAILLLLFTLVAFMTYTATPNGPAYNTYAVSHHTEIMAGLVVIAVIFGFVLSQFLFAEIKRTRKESQNILGIVLQFLSGEERSIINLLVRSGGSTTQAEVARLPHMNRVKAHRSLQKMQEKQLIELVPHGKVRRVLLKENLLQLLTEKE